MQARWPGQRAVSWSTESLLMIGPNHFRGQIESGKYMEMRRGDGVAKVKPSKAE